MNSSSTNMNQIFEAGSLNTTDQNEFSNLDSLNATKHPEYYPIPPEYHYIPQCEKTVKKRGET